MNQRGVLIKKVQEMAKGFLGREISVTELRVYPYIDYCVKNGNRIDFNKINEKENEILEQLEKEGHLNFYGNAFLCTRKFYDFLQNVLAEAYVNDFLE